MSLDYKIKKYKKYIIGYAYYAGIYDFNTYLVIKKEKIEFILLKYYDINRKEQLEELINKYKKIGYKDIIYYEKENVKKLVKKDK